MEVSKYYNKRKRTIKPVCVSIIDVFPTTKYSKTVSCLNKMTWQESGWLQGFLED
jgi:hypothetical protein